MDGSAPRGAPKTWAYGTVEEGPGDLNMADLAPQRYQGMLGYTGWGGGYLPKGAPRYPVYGIDHLPKGHDLVTWDAAGYLGAGGKAGPDVVNGTNDPRFSHMW